nr:unnamed protein product [Digitaria exilis]
MRGLTFFLFAPGVETPVAAPPLPFRSSSLLSISLSLSLNSTLLAAASSTMDLIWA